MKSGELVATDDGNAITVQPRIVTPLILFVCGIAAAALFVVLSVLLSGALPALAAFARWAATTLVLLSLCFPLAAGYVSVARRAKLDTVTQTLSRGRRRYPFRQIDGILVRTTAILDQKVLTIVARVGDREILLVSGHTPGHAEEMQRTAARMQALVSRSRSGRGAAAPGSDAEAPVTARRSGATGRFVGAVLIVFGIVVSGSAYLLVPDLVLTRHGMDFGFLFWPVGIWIAAAGIVSISGIAFVPHGSTRPRTPGAVGLRVALVSAWLVSYFVVAFTRL
jgi:hypothetical protein